VQLTPAFKWLLIVLIPLTFTWELVAEYPAGHEKPGKIARFLTNQGFEVRERSLMQGLLVVRATSSDCSMLVAEVSPDGSMRDIIRQEVSTTMDRRFVVFRGHVYDEQPTWITVTQDLWLGFLRKLGVSYAGVPAIMVAANHSCGDERLAWVELSGG